MKNLQNIIQSSIYNENKKNTNFEIQLVNKVCDNFYKFDVGEIKFHNILQKYSKYKTQQYRLYYHNDLTYACYQQGIQRCYKTNVYSTNYCNNNSLFYTYREMYVSPDEFPSKMNYNNITDVEEYQIITKNFVTIILQKLKDGENISYSVKIRYTIKNENFKKTEVIQSLFSTYNSLISL